MNFRFPHAMFLFVFLLFIWGHAISQQTGDITGRVIDATTGTPLSGANVIVKETVMGGASNLDGEFRVTGIPAGTYTVQITVIGYTAYSESVTIRANETVQMDVVMQPTIIESPQLVVTGAKRSVRMMDSPGSVGTIRPEDVEMRMPSTIMQILPYEPGVQEVGGQINIRGSSGYTRGAGSRVLVLIDGIPMLASDNAGIYWDAIPVENIESVEILKGAGSALYGSNALGGVVNVLTRPISEKPLTLISAQTGLYTFPSYKSWQWRSEPLVTGKFHLSNEKTVGEFGYRIGAGYDGSAGYYQNGWYDRWNLQGQLNYSPSDNVSLNTRIFLVDDRHGVFTQWRNAHEPFNAPLEAAGDYITNDKFQWAFSYSKIVSPRTAVKWRALYYRTSFQNYLHNSDDYSTAHRIYSEWQTDYQASSQHLVTWGIEGSANLVTANLWNDHQGYDLAAYLQDEYSLNTRFKLVAGARLDASKTDKYRSKIQVNPKFGLNYRITDTWSFRASTGRGYRVPSISERFVDTQQGFFSTRPNPDLQPELSWNHEVGTRYEISNFTMDMAGFYYRYEDLIEPLQDAGTGDIYFDNVTNARIYGAETSVKFKVPFLPVQQSVSYTYLDPYDLTADTVLAYRHRHFLLLKTDWALARNIYTSAEYQFRSKIQRVQLFPHNPETGADNRVPVHLWNLHAGYRLTENLTLRLSISNLLQYYYVMYERNMGAPSQVQLGFSYRM